MCLDFGHEARLVVSGLRGVPNATTGESLVTSRCFVATIAVPAMSVAVCGSARAAGPHIVTLTPVRDAQSVGNASGLIDTSVPGLELTPRGWCQAMLDAGPLGARHYGGSYASTMIRTQQTATPTAQWLGEPVDVLSGRREIPLGADERARPRPLTAGQQSATQPGPRGATGNPAAGDPPPC